MFFGKQEEPELPEQPLKPFRVTILTDEYIIDALDDPEFSIFMAAYDSEVQEPTGGLFILKDAYVKPLGNVHTPARTFSEWRMPSFVKVIAIISDDPVAEDMLVNNWPDHEHPFQAIIYAGGFTIEGKIFSEDEEPPKFELRTFVPLEEANITYQLDQKTESIRGRWGVVNSVMMHGFSIE